MKIPDLTSQRAEELLKPYNLPGSVFLLGIRGYGDGINEVGIYDDCVAIVAPDFFKAYNANTDPSRLLSNVAVLQPGVYDYAIGLHGISHLNMKLPADQALYDQLVKTKLNLAPIEGRILPYWALRQHSDVTVKRVGKTEPETDSPAHRFWIDIHRGGYSTTSSAGCQTIHPDQWFDFYWKNVKPLMERYSQPVIKYVLMDQT